MGHSHARAALIYLNSTEERQRETADALGGVAAGELTRKTAERGAHPGADRHAALLLRASGSVADNRVVKDAFDAVGQHPVGWMAITERLRLRLLRAADAVPLREVTEDGWVEDLAARSGDRTLSPWAIVLRDGDAIVGLCGFIVRPVKGTTMGYGIVSKYRDRGYATEAATAVLDWAECHDVDVYASIRPPNPASARVLEKVGMRLVDSYRDEDGQRDIYRR
jgi:hypothetical protein